MLFHAMGMNYRHDPDFSVDRPKGSGDCLLVVFLTSAYISEGDETFHAPPVSAVIYREGYPQKYGACGDIYVNHFLHMDCEGEETFIEKTGLSFGALIPLSDISGTEEILRMISRRSTESSDLAEEYMDMLIKMLILELAESSRKGALLSPSGQHSAALSALRGELYSNAGRYKCIADLASAVNLSPSHFQSLYRKQFGISCYEDMLRARIGAAKYYLKNTDISVKETASLCGYENDVVFMRLFRSRTGLTPTEFRNAP